MVSSTFYDLRQHRDDLRRFLEDELGYRALLSEHPSFPINPERSTVDNCQERVERDADILVLVVGRRYGSLDDRSARSITNLEYLAARNKGIPIYAFADRGILEVLPVWKENPTADFSKQVDSTQLFEFVEQVRSKDRVWVREFDRAHDIIDALRVQFAYQHREGLTLAGRLRGRSGSPWLEALSGEALRLALEQPTGWEIRLFAAALSDAIAARYRLRRRHALNIPIGLGEDVHVPFKWLQARFQDALRITSGFNSLVNTELAAALEARDIERIVFVVESLGTLYEDALRWANKVLTANVEEPFRPALQHLSATMDEIIREIEQISPKVTDAIQAPLAAIAAGKQPEPVALTFTIRVPEEKLQAYQEALQAAVDGV